MSEHESGAAEQPALGGEALSEYAPPLDVARLRRMLEAATPGPWKSPEGWCIQSPKYAVAITTRGPGQKRDAALIVAARNALPALLDAAEERDALRDFINAGFNCDQKRRQADISAAKERGELRRERDALQAELAALRGRLECLTSSWEEEVTREDEALHSRIDRRDAYLKCIGDVNQTLRDALTGGESLRVVHFSAAAIPGYSPCWTYAPPDLERCLSNDRRQVTCLKCLRGALELVEQQAEFAHGMIAEALTGGGGEPGAEGRLAVIFDALTDSAINEDDRGEAIALDEVESYLDRCAEARQQQPPEAAREEKGGAA